MKTLEALIEAFPDEEWLIADGFDEVIYGRNKYSTIKNVR